MDLERTTGKYEGLDREELRAAVWADADGDSNRLAYDPRYCRMFGTAPGLMLSQLVFWSGKGHDPDGWLHLTKDAMIERFGLAGRYEVDEARHRLQDAGVLEWTKKARRDEHGVCRWGPSPVLHYKVNLARLAELLDGFGTDPDGTTASIKRCFKPSKVGGSDAQDVSAGKCKQSTVGGLNGRRSAIQTVDGRRLERPTLDRSKALGSAVLNTESTSETTDRDHNREDDTGKEKSSDEDQKKAPLSFASSTNKEQFYSSLDGDNDAASLVGSSSSAEEERGDDHTFSGETEGKHGDPMGYAGGAGRETEGAAYDTAYEAGCAARAEVVRRAREQVREQLAREKGGTHEAA